MVFLKSLKNTRKTESFIDLRRCSERSEEKFFLLQPVGALQFVEVKRIRPGYGTVESRLHEGCPVVLE